MPRSEEREKDLVSWLITEALEEAEYQRLITRDRVRYYYDLIGHRCYLYDLLPSKRYHAISDVPVMIDQIRRRIEMEAERQQKELIMAHKAIIVGAHKEKVPDEKYLVSVLSDYDTCLCVAYVTEDGSIGMDKANGTTGVDGIAEMVKAIPQEKVMFFGKYEAEYHDDDLQPFILIEENYNFKDGGVDRSEKKPTLVCFLEGDFTAFAHPESNHSNEFFAVEEFIKNEVNTLWANCETLEILVKTMDEPAFRKKMQLALGGRGHITFMAGVEVDSGGKIWTVATNPLAGSAEWGWTSNKLDATCFTPAAVAEKTVEAAASSWRKSRTAIPAGVAAASVPSVPPTDTRIPADAGKPKEVIHYPPADVRGDQKKLKNWFEKNYREKQPYPQNWKSGTVGIPESMLHPKSVLRTPKQSTTVSATGDISVKPAQTAGVTTEQLATMSPEQHAKLEDFLKKIKPEDLPGSVEDVKSQEKEFAPLWERMGRPKEEMLKYSFLTLLNMGHLSVLNLAMLAKDYRNLIFELNPRILGESSEEEEAKVEAPKAAAASSWRKGKVA